MADKVYEAQIENYFISGSQGWVFDIINLHSVSINNNITDNYLENGTAIQDNITHSPKVVTIGGLVGELVFPQKGWQEYENYKVTNKGITVGDKLGQLGSLFPSVSNKVQAIKQNTAFAINIAEKYAMTAFNAIADFLPRQANVDFFDGTIDYINSRIASVYRDLEYLQANNKSFTIETPFNTFDDMFIQSMTMRQGDSNYIAELEITFKQVNYADIYFTDKDASKLNQIAQAQRAEEENNGKAQGQKVPPSKLAQLVGTPDKPEYYKK